MDIDKFGAFFLIMGAVCVFSSIIAVATRWETDAGLIITVALIGIVFVAVGSYITKRR